MKDGVAAGENLRFLFVMPYPGYLRYFDSTVLGLAARGHHVDVAFDSPHKQAEGVEALAGAAGGVDVLGRMPTRGDVWVGVARAVRGAVDYVRYLHPSFAGAPYLRERMRAALPPALRFLGRWSTASVATTNRLTRLFTTCERAIPSSSVLEDFIQSRRPDAVLVTPLVMDRSPQVDVVKSAQALGIPTALCVGSWDHLTTKGLIRVQPDLISVWNEEQKAEALAFHGAAAERIVVTGAPPFDRWFDRRPTARTAFCCRIGLPPDRPYVLFVGSTASISAPDAELRFVRRWIEMLRREPPLAEVGLLVRPHPYNSIHWRDADFSDLPNVVVFPRAANPVNERDRQDYFDSLYHSAAVVGVNTTAMIEAAIVGRTVHSVMADEFTDTQAGTLHFRYLLSENGGFLRIATSLSEHAQQIVETLESPEIARDACARFVRTFVRPLGVDQPATPVLVGALERLARSGRRAPLRFSPALHPLRLFLWTVGRVELHDPQRFKGRVLKAARNLGKRVRRVGRRVARRRRGARVGVPAEASNPMPESKLR